MRVLSMDFKRKLKVAERAMKMGMNDLVKATGLPHQLPVATVGSCLYPSRTSLVYKSTLWTSAFENFSWRVNIKNKRKQGSKEPNKTRRQITPANLPNSRKRDRANVSSAKKTHQRNRPRTKLHRRRKITTDVAAREVRDISTRRMDGYNFFHCK